MKQIRIFAILHLCIVFSTLSWLCSYPFFGELFTYKSKALLHENVRTHPLFSTLPASTTHSLDNHYQTLNQHTSFSQKLSTSVDILLNKISPLKQLWLLLSFFIPLTLLLKKEGASHAAWLLPLLSICYLLDNHWNGYPPQKGGECSLFPTEKILIEDYLQEPLSPQLSIQKEQLTRGLHLYLIAKWLNETPSADPALFEKQVDRATFSFNVARLQEQAATPPPDLKYPFRRQTPLPLLAFYVAWNILFAYGVNRRPKDYAPRAHPQT